MGQPFSTPTEILLPPAPGESTAGFKHAFRGFGTEMKATTAAATMVIAAATAGNLGLSPPPLPGPTHSQGGGEWR